MSAQKMPLSTSSVKARRASGAYMSEENPATVRSTSLRSYFLVPTLRRMSTRSARLMMLAMSRVSRSPSWRMTRRSRQLVWWYRTAREARSRNGWSRSSR
ncbi:hypothetical protein [Pseudodesulfovibrio indicus]|uniref:hypothetical protein n=1 Tax=Pseudodesulfovibrio indicus TaxID=1716143 RepID=UPI001F1E862B|nr:hypothetical protein [Pseudodesulfovibrio indicus]